MATCIPNNNDYHLVDPTRSRRSLGGGRSSFLSSSHRAGMPSPLTRRHPIFAAPLCLGLLYTCSMVSDVCARLTMKGLTPRWCNSPTLRMILSSPILSDVLRRLVLGLLRRRVVSDRRQVR